MTPDQIKAAIRARMESEAITSAEVARRTGEVQPQIHRKIAGKVTMSVEDACAIAGACGLAIKVVRAARTRVSRPNSNVR